MKAGTTLPYTVADQERMSRAHRYFEWQSRMAERQLGQRVLEIGCGLGNFSQHLTRRELVVGIDVEAECIFRWQQRFRDCPHYLGMTLSAADQAFIELKKYGPDSIACLNVLEHVRDDMLALGHMKAVLPRGGRIVLIVPAFPALYGRIDRNLGHYRRYTRASLRNAAAAAGLSMVTLRFFNSVGFFGWWVNAKILKKENQSEGQIAFFDAFIVPAMSSAESLISPPFGQSLFAVLEKTAT